MGTHPIFESDFDCLTVFRRKDFKMTEDICVTRFREYIRINTMQPTPDYKAADEFLRKYADEIGLEYSSHECVQGKPCIVMTWIGSDESLGSVMLNSHIDVV